jgi:DNA (cytosine-5)-methyltransferase 1
MGFPPDFKIPVSDTQAYRQFGNAVVVPVVERLAKAIVETLLQPVGYKPDLVLQSNETNSRYKFPLRNR